MIRVGVIGYGYWGPNLVRNFAEQRDVQVAAVSDLRQPRVDLAKQRFPGILATTDHKQLFADPSIDAIAISTPVSTHFELAIQALQAGKHVLVEKPITANSEDALRLMEEADKRRLVLMVDHTFIYTGAVRKIRELVESKALGDIYYYDSVRINLGLFQQDINVIWDLAVHDLAIMNYVLGAKPTAVSATGVRHLPDHPENIAYISMFFEKELMAHIHVNWLSPVKVRSTLVSGSEKMVVYDDMEVVEKVKVYDRGVNLSDNQEGLYKLLLGYRSGDMWAPKLDNSEALSSEIQHFVSCIEKGVTPLSGAAEGLEIVRILEAATESMKYRGRPVELVREKSLTA